MPCQVPAPTGGLLTAAGPLGALCEFPCVRERVSYLVLNPWMRVGRRRGVAACGAR